MSKKTSKSARWSAAIAAALEALDTAKIEFENADNEERDPDWDVICSAAKDFNNAASDANTVRSEYEDWYYNMPESLQESATGEKLHEICYCELDDVALSWDEKPSRAIDSAEIDSYMYDIEEAQSLFEELEALEVPLGFGRD